MKFDAAIAIAVTVYGLAWWWPERGAPYFWDTAMFVIPAARDLLATHFHPFIASHTPYPHPPFFMALVALAWRIFGDSRLVAHAVTLPFVPLVLYGTYALGSSVADRSVGAAAAALLGAMAVVLEECGQVYLDLPAASAVVWGLVAWSKRRTWAAGVLLSLAAANKIYTVVVAGALLVLAVSSPGPGRTRREAAPLLLPFAFVAGWLAYHRAVLGWWFLSSSRQSEIPRTFGQSFLDLAVVARMILLDQWRIGLLGCALVAVLVARARRKVWPPVGAIAPLAVVVVAGCLVFAAIGEFGTRYALFVYPAYVVGCLALARPAGAAPFALVCVGTLGLFVTTWHPRRPPTRELTLSPDPDLGYRDMIAIGTGSAAYLSREHPRAIVYGSVPEVYELTAPYEGYVESPLRFSSCGDFVPEPDEEQIIVRHAYAREQITCGRLIELTRARPLTRFRSNDKWVELYRVPGPAP